MKPEETQQLSCAGNLEKALLHQPLQPSFFVLTAQDSSMHRLVSFAICKFTDAFLNHKVDQMVLINYDGQRRSTQHKISSLCCIVKICSDQNIGLMGSKDKNMELNARYFELPDKRQLKF